jgi:ADP-heptose:LPS heptosyltransferase
MGTSQGVIKAGNNTRLPARVLNVQSKKHTENKKIRLDRLIRSENPIICIKRRLGGIGDVLMTTPLLKAIKTLIPNCYLVYATDLKYAQGALADVIKHNPYVDQLISSHEVKEEEYDYCVDITQTGLSQERSGLVPPNRIDMFADEVGVSVDADPVPVYEVTEEERLAANQKINEEFLLGAKREEVKLIVIQARSNDVRRTWPLDHVEALLDLLAADPKIRVILLDWGTSANRWKKKDRIFPILDKDLAFVASLIEQSDLVICPDSAILHLAGALSKKTIGIFGPIPPESRINHYDNATAVRLQLPCKNCWYTPVCLRRSTGKLDCLVRITPQMVYEAIMERLTEEPKVAPNVKYGKDIATVGNQDPIILVRRLTPGLGDLLMAVNGIEALRVKYPNKQIHVAVHKNLIEAISNNPCIDEVLNVDDAINPRRYSMIFDISSPCARYESARVRSGKPVQKNRVEIYAEAMGVRELLRDLKPKYYVSDTEKASGVKFLAANDLNKNKKTIGITMRSAEIYRDWPAANEPLLIEALKDDFNLVIFDVKRHCFYENAIDACGLPLRMASGILANCDLLLTVDSGFLHIATAINLPTIALFGPIDYKARCKGYDNVTVMVSDLPCVPCWRNANIKCKQTGLVKAYSKCMESITVKQVVETINKKIRN